MASDAANRRGWESLVRDEKSNSGGDPLSPEERSEQMSRVRNKDTKPEMLVRRLAHEMGYRYRLHSGRLPGRPDMVFAGRRKVIFVHGCFWHRHEEVTDDACPLTRTPKTRLDFWKAKFEGNKERDQRNLASLRESGWDSLVIWECQTRDVDELSRRIRRFLG